MTDASGGQGQGGGTATTDAQGAAGAAGAAAGAPAPTAGAPAPQAGAQVAEADAAAQAARQLDTSAWPADAQAAYQRQQTENERLRRERGDERIAAKATAAQDGARKALAEAARIAGLEIPGLTDTDKGPGDPQLLAAQVSSISTERDQARRDAATYKAAMEAGIAPSKLSYVEFELSRDPALRAADVAAEDFGAKLSASLAALVAKDATLKLTGSAVASGVENLGGANGSGAITPEAFKGMSIQERQDLYFSDKATYDKLVAAQ